MQGRGWLLASGVGLVTGLVLMGCGAIGSSPGLGIGQTPPELAGQDANGKPVNLAEHRGKVVIIDFWATWCGPCRLMIPHEKSLLRRLEGQPLVLLGVSADHDVEDLRAYIEREKLSWTNVFDGPNGPLVRDWKIEAFPTVFILDKKGVIRFKFVGVPTPSEMERAVKQLLSE